MRIKDMMAFRNIYKTAYKNYISVMWNIWRGNDKIKVILQNGDSNYVIKNLVRSFAGLITNKNAHISDLHLENDYIKFTYNSESIIIEDDTGDIVDVFGREDYSFLKVENETVVDIGANIGDSTIYFALNNAKKVIALEPYPYPYNIALKNIKINNLEDRIILLNAGCGQDGTIKVNPELGNTLGSDLKSFNDGIDIKIMSLKTLLNDYNIDKAILKMDCEGCGIIY